MLDKNWDTIRPLTFDGTITEYEFLCKILNQIETVQKELQEEIDNIVVGGVGITDEERQKIDSLTNTGIQLMNSLTEGDVSRLKVLTDNGANWANQINGYQGEGDDVVARAQWVLTKAQEFYAQVAPRLLPTVSAADNGKVAKVVGGQWGIGTVEGGGDSKWTDAAVEYFATVLEHLVYDDASTGQTAATYLLNILRGGAPLITGITAEWSYGQVIYPDTALTSDMFTVRAAYSDGSVVRITEFTFEPQVASTNPTEVTITYEGKTATVSVPVGTVSLTGITAEYVGTGTIYVGDNLTKNMFRVTANYNDGSSTVVSDYTFTPVTMLNAGEQVVTFTYQGKETTATVTVVALSVTRIRASWIGGTIFKGTAFTKSMFSVTAEYNNGTSNAVSDYTFTPATANSTPTTLVIIEYEGKTATVSVPVGTVSLTGITAEYVGTGTIYVGDNLTKNMFRVTANYNDGSSTVVSDYTFTPVTMLNAGEQVVTFTYQGKETTATVTVVALSVTRIRASWIGGTIFKGTAFTKSMFSVTAEYNNGTSNAVSDYTFTPATANSTPTTLVIIEYEGKTTGLSVNVIDAIASILVVNSYTLNSGVARIYPGDKFLEKGKFNVTVNYSDGSSSTITDNSGLAVSPESADSAGEKIVTVSLVASPTVSGTVGITVSEAPKVNTISAVYNGANNPTVGDVLTIANFTVIHTDQYQNVILSGWTKDYLSNETGTEIASITVVEGEQTVYVRCLTDDARTIVTSTVVTGEKAGATSSGGTAQGTGKKTFSNIVQDNAVTNPTSITFTSQNETQPSGGANQCYKVILTKEGNNWTMAFYRFAAKNTPYPGETARPYATVAITDGIVTAVTLPKFQSSDTLAVNSYTANGYTYTMEVS